MEHRYRQLMRRVKLYLLKEKRKKSFMSRFFGAGIFNDEYWALSRRGVTVGATLGAVAAISPLPMQSLWGIAGCLWKKGNIPIAVLMAWLSPPGFTIVAVPAQWYLGNVVLEFLGLSSSGANWTMMTEVVQQMTIEPLQHLNVWYIGIEFTLGWILSSFVVGLLVFLLVQSLWTLGAVIRRYKKYKKYRAE